MMMYARGFSGPFVISPQAAASLYQHALPTALYTVYSPTFCNQLQALNSAVSCTANTYDIWVPLTQFR
ncbi:hypothetical protein BaRGS_00021683, partial [Batillaria attramentaria]